MSPMNSANDFYSTLPDTEKKNGPKRLTDHLIHYLFRLSLRVYLLLINFFKFIRPAHSSNSKKLDILITGTFFSDNWIIALLRPLALSERCGRIRFVSTSLVPSIEKVEPIYPSRLLIKYAGRTPARLMTFIWLGIRTKPDIIGGLHLLVNGLTAIILSKMIGAKALYSCCGGPTECEGGGYKSENHLFCRLTGPDPFIERSLLKAVSEADLVITRGSTAINFFKKHHVQSNFHIIPGGMDGALFSPSSLPFQYDLITVGNLVPRKRVDIFLDIVAKVHTLRPKTKAVILGDGPLKEVLIAQASELDLQDVVTFAGYQTDVASWLKLTRIFVLTSEAEGLSQAMIQAMLCGLPTVASHVGEVEELVHHGQNGFLIPDLNAEDFSQSIVKLLENQQMFTNFSKAARTAAQRCDVHNLAQTWDVILSDIVKLNETP